MHLQIPRDGIRILFVLTSGGVSKSVLGAAHPRSLMNLRYAICCLNIESPRERHGPVSTLFMAAHLRSQFIFCPPPPPPRTPCLSLCRSSFLAFAPAPPSVAVLPRPANLDPGSSAAEEGRRDETEAGCEREKRSAAVGRRRLKYHEDIIRYPPRRLSVSPPSL